MGGVAGHGRYIKVKHLNHACKIMSLVDPPSLNIPLPIRTNNWWLKGKHIHGKEKKDVQKRVVNFKMMK